jgi:hypothetical protein
MPVPRTLTDPNYVVVDELTYRDGGRWGEWINRGGSSLELIDPRSDNRRSANWTHSDERNKSQWVTIEHTGVLDNGRGTADELHIFLPGAGECLYRQRDRRFEAVPTWCPTAPSNRTQRLDLAGESYPVGLAYHRGLSQQPQPAPSRHRWR